MELRVRDKRGSEGVLGKRNMSSICEYIVYYDNDGGVDTISLNDLEVELPNGSWKKLIDACADHDVINDNLDTMLFFPSTEEDRLRGYTLS